MDYVKMIKDLREDLASISGAIASLERLQGLRNGGSAYGQALRRRGRKSMGMEERKVVSARMKAYWAGRRKQA